MSQRRKGPGRPPTSSTIPSLSPAPSPRTRAVLLPLTPKHKIFLCSKGPPWSLCWCLSICLSYPPAWIPGAWTGPGLQPWLVASPHLCCLLPTLPRPMSARM